MDNLDAPAEVPEFQPPETAETGVIYISPFTEPQMKRRKRQGGRKSKSRKGKVSKSKRSGKSRRRRRKAKVPEERLNNFNAVPVPAGLIHPYYMPRYY